MIAKDKQRTFFAVFTIYKKKKVGVSPLLDESDERETVAFVTKDLLLVRIQNKFGFNDSKE